jgi:hypothetical protein
MNDLAKAKPLERDVLDKRACQKFHKEFLLYTFKLCIRNFVLQLISLPKMHEQYG